MNTNLIQVKENETVTTSLLVAEKFNKNHAHILRAINELISKIDENPILDSPRLFEKSEYKTSQNKVLPMYYMTRDGFTLLAMGFTGAEALKWKLEYIEAFNTMEKMIRSGESVDHRLEIAHMILEAPDDRVQYIRGLYPEYFSADPDPESFEYVSDLNTSYQKWVEDLCITKEWIEDFPTVDIYRNYVRYCMENRYISMGKKLFYRTLETDFNLSRRQKSNGYRYFIPA